MSEYESINKLLNKALRALDEIAREVVNLEHNPDEENLRKVVEAIDILSDVQNSIWTADPDLSVHYEGENKEDTKYMKEFRELLISAKSYEKNNDISSAILELQKALNMEPPGIMYEVITKELHRLQDVCS